MTTATATPKVTMNTINRDPQSMCRGCRCPRPRSIALRRSPCQPVGSRPYRARANRDSGQAGKFSPSILIVVVWVRLISYHWHHPQPAHSMLMLPAVAGPYSVAPWARRRFTTSCVVSRPLPMPRLPGPTRTGPVIAGKTACSPTGRMGWRRFTTISDAHTRQMPSSGGPWRGDREQSFPRQPTRDTHRQPCQQPPRLTVVGSDVRGLGASVRQQHHPHSGNWYGATGGPRRSRRAQLAPRNDHRSVRACRSGTPILSSA